MNFTNSCVQCGVCCRLFLINLDETEYKSGKYKTIFDDIISIDNFDEASECGANLLAQNKDGSCIYLKNNSCSIHDIRPQVCREYFCNSKESKFKDMHKTIARYKERRTDLGRN